MRIERILTLLLLGGAAALAQDVAPTAKQAPIGRRVRSYSASRPLASLTRMTKQLRTLSARAIWS